MTISSGKEDLSDCVDDDDTRSFTYAEELASLELASAENPENAEENDEESMELLCNGPDEHQPLRVSRSVVTAAPHQARLLLYLVLFVLCLVLVLFLCLVLVLLLCLVLFYI
ncbi:hypothetical protein POJ06DRAFT_133778 [Lipomyces tetrasporus]|uniref:Uncharacterized protein n=1 Tax=Lipomyces tetrasporus TaxID=54092 RepID=A0AAD7QQF8_9ASCO|nr:uncharacterized protein POJ06DRAFT_133778 [Lipomyces tetrasporus]KAJ8099360.1 hypothetical protein POJ06DRAFT_133778 [Lipomyces tetrasporus]